MGEKNKFVKGFLSGVLVCFLVVAAAVFGNRLLNIEAGEMSLKSKNGSDKTKESTPTSADTIQKISVLEQYIDKYYMEETENEKMIDGLYTGLLYGLDDPYSVYYNKAEYASMMDSTNGVYFGIGAMMSQNVQSGIITLIKMYEGTPSQEAGLQPGDILYQVDGKEVTGMDLTAVVGLIKGAEGSKVTISIIREGQEEPFDVEVERRQIEVPTVSSEMLDNQVGYILVSSFEAITAEQFRSALDQLEQQGMKALVVDLRNNGGGVLDTACDMLNQLLPEGIITYTEDKNGSRKEYKADGKRGFDLPLAVLVNGNSASASEVFAGAIQDYGVGKLVGTKTYGKGIVQSIIPLGDGTAIKLTTAKYFTPSGNNIHKIGIEPDIEIELPEDLKKKAVLSPEEDVQLKKAIESLD